MAFYLYGGLYYFLRRHRLPLTMEKKNSDRGDIKNNVFDVWGVPTTAKQRAKRHLLFNGYPGCQSSDRCLNSSDVVGCRVCCSLPSDTGDVSNVRFHTSAANINAVYGVCSSAHSKRLKGSVASRDVSRTDLCSGDMSGQWVSKDCGSLTTTGCFSPTAATLLSVDMPPVHQLRSPLASTVCLSSTPSYVPSTVIQPGMSTMSVAYSLKLHHIVRLANYAIIAIQSAHRLAKQLHRFLTLILKLYLLLGKLPIQNYIDELRLTVVLHQQPQTAVHFAQALFVRKLAQGIVHLQRHIPLVVVLSIYIVV